MKTCGIVLTLLVAVVAIYAICELHYWLYVKHYNRERGIPSKADWEGWKKVEKYLSLDEEEYHKHLVEASYKALDVKRDTLEKEEE